MAVQNFVRYLISVTCIMIASHTFAADAQVNTFNMQDAEISTVIELVAKLTGKTFIIDPRVRGKVTVMSEKKMTKSQIYETFLAVLEVYGFSAVVAGDVVKVIGQSDIKSAGIEVDTEGGRVGEQIITRVFPIQNASAMELVPILRPLVAKYGHLAGVPSANVLIIADRATNIERMSEIVHLLDKAGSEEIEVINLKHAWVGGMITLLERISPTAVAAGAQASRNTNNRGVQLVGDERSNRIIVKGEKEARAQIIELITKLDTPSRENASYKVIFLNNADAKKMAEILKGISAPAAAAGQGAPPTQPVSILADEEQNALIVRAEPDELIEIESIISQLDIPRAQVLIEAAIVEVTGNDTNAFGVQWASNPESAGDGVPLVSTSSGVGGSSIGKLAEDFGGGITLANGSPLGALASVPAGAFVGLADPFGSTVDFGVVIQALQSASNTNFLSTPSVLTLDNSEAFITVGNSVPFKTGGSGEGDNPFTIDRQDVGTTLTVIPHVQQNGTIRLEVDQTVESVDETVSYDVSDVVTKKRQVKTEVLINDGETIVLGGLISDQISESESRVPVLGYIPIIGNLFKSKSTLKVKTNLLIILKPTIVQDEMVDYRNKRLNGIWELRIQALEGPKDLIQPSIDQIFNGDYINGAKKIDVPAENSEQIEQ